MACTGPVFSKPAPQRSKVRKADIKRAIHHAQNLCLNFEDTPECRVAWDHVEELTAEYARAQERYEPPRPTELANREYDL